MAIELTPDQLEAIRSGEVVVESKPVDNLPQGQVWAAIWIPEPVEAVWDTMLDCDAAPNFVPGMKTCEILETGTNTDVRRHRVDIGFLLPDVQYVFRADYTLHQTIRFERVSGGLQSMEGTWRFEPDPATEGTLVRYSVFIDPGFFVPQWMVRKMLRANLPEILEALRNEVIIRQTETETVATSHVP